MVHDAAQEGLGQVPFRVGRDDDDGPQLRGAFELQLGTGHFRHVEAQAFDGGQEVVGQVPGGFVQFVYQHHAAAAFPGCDQDGLAQGFVADELLRLIGLRVGLFVLCPAEMAQGVVVVEEVFFHRGGLHLIHEGFRPQVVEGAGDVPGQTGLARARLARQQEGLP